MSYVQNCELIIWLIMFNNYNDVTENVMHTLVYDKICIIPILKSATNPSASAVSSRLYIAFKTYGKQR